VDEIVNSLIASVDTSTPQQIQAWKRSVPPLQKECGDFSKANSSATNYGAVLEYYLPDSLKRADVILLLSGSVLVIELKGDVNQDEEYLEQVADYARRLSSYFELAPHDMKAFSAIPNRGQAAFPFSRSIGTAFFRFLAVRGGGICKAARISAPGFIRSTRASRDL